MICLFSFKENFILTFKKIFFFTELAMQSQAHEIKEDWKPSFLSNDEFTQLMLEVSQSDDCIKLPIIVL